jgi:2-methylaconitate cis-trans-isomerase PrpF
LTTTKFAMLGPSTRAGADVDYSFFQIGIDRPVVGRDANFGNISAAFGPFAIEAGLVSPSDGMVTVTIHNTNTDRPIYSTPEVRNGRPVSHGDLHIDGVPGTGPPIRLDFRDGTRGRTGSLLPTGHVRDTFEVRRPWRDRDVRRRHRQPGRVRRRQAFGLTGTEDPMALQNDEPMNRVESLHEAVLLRLGLAASDSEASEEVVPFVSLVGPPASCFGRSRDISLGVGRLLAEHSLRSRSPAWR